MDQAQNALDGVRERLYAFCFPNVPATLMEQEAFERAAELQYAYEQETPPVPAGVQSFRIGEFQMTMAEGEGRMGRKICPEAYGLLLRHGLLYRGVEGRRGG